MWYKTIQCEHDLATEFSLALLVFPYFRRVGFPKHRSEFYHGVLIYCSNIIITRGRNRTTTSVKFPEKVKQIIVE